MIQNMTKSVLFFVFVSIIFAGIESAADAASIVIDVDHNNGHEIHGSTHAESHEHNGADHDEDDFCHCNAHTAAILSCDVASPAKNQFVSVSRYQHGFSSLVDPPLLRPPNR